MGESSNKSEDNKKEKIVINLDEAKMKAVSNTYSLYTSLEVEEEVMKKEGSVRSNIKSKSTDSVKSLKPELQKPIRKLLNSVSKDQVKKLMNPTEDQKERLFNKKGANTFGDLSDKEKTILMKKMEDWKVNEDTAEINASVSIAWVNNVGQPQETSIKKNINNSTNKK